MCDGPPGFHQPGPVLSDSPPYMQGSHIAQCNLKHVFREWFRHFYVLSLNWMKPTPFDPIGYAVSQKNYPFSQKFIFGHSRNLSSEVFGKNLVFCL